MKRNGPWYLLCDNEAFLNASGMSETEHVRVCGPMPYLNRIQLLWSYLRNPLRRRLDLADAFRNRPALSKMA